MTMPAAAPMRMNTSGPRPAQARPGQPDLVLELGDPAHSHPAADLEAEEAADEDADDEHDEHVVNGTRHSVT